MCVFWSYHAARLVLDAVVHNDLCALLRLYGWYWYHATGGFLGRDGRGEP